MLTQVRKKILQKGIKNYSELRITDWWNSSIISYVKNHSDSGKQRYSTEKRIKSFEKFKTPIHIPYYQIGNGIYSLIPCYRGSFTRGRESENYYNPPEEMEIEKSFLLGETEITRELYESVMGVSPSIPKNIERKVNFDAKAPIIRVSWYDALIFCNKLSDVHGLTRYYTITKDGKIVDKIAKEQKDYVVEMNLTSKGFRLPTEWEWEYAAKAGTQLIYSGSDDISEVGFFNFNSGGKAQLVKLKKPNAWGFYDMSGNANEWCENTPIKYSSTLRAVRGGSAMAHAWNTRIVARYAVSPRDRDKDLGFRVCRYIQVND